MSNTSIEQMKKLIDDKKKKGLEQNLNGSTNSKWNSTSSKGFKNIKKGGSLNK